MLQLIGEKGELQDRPRNQMREHRHEAGKIDEVGHRFGLAAIDVDGVAKCLECVETDAERQHHAEERFPLKMTEANGADDFVICFNAKVEIFEKTERHQIAHDRDSNGSVLE